MLIFPAWATCGTRRSHVFYHFFQTSKLSQGVYVRILAPARVSYRDDFLISYRVYMMTGSFQISLLEGTLHLDKIHLWFKIANITHALPVPVYRQTDFTKKRVVVSRLHDTVVRFRTGVNFSPQYNNRSELTPGVTRAGMTFRGGIKCRAMRGTGVNSLRRSSRPQLVDWLHFTLNQFKVLKHLRRLLRSYVTELRMRVSNDSTWKGWPNFFKFRGTNSVAISSSWILAIRGYFSLSTILPCKIKNKFRYTNKKSDKIGLCLAWFQKSVRFSKIQYGGQLKITTEQPQILYMRRSWHHFNTA